MDLPARAAGGGQPSRRALRAGSPRELECRIELVRAPPTRARPGSRSVGRARRPPNATRCVGAVGLRGAVGMAAQAQRLGSPGHLHLRASLAAELLVSALHGNVLATAPPVVALELVLRHRPKRSARRVPRRRRANTDRNPARSPGRFLSRSSRRPLRRRRSARPFRSSEKPPTARPGRPASAACGSRRATRRLPVRSPTCARGSGSPRVPPCAPPRGPPPRRIREPFPSGAPLFVHSRKTPSFPFSLRQRSSSFRCLVEKCCPGLGWGSG